MKQALFKKKKATYVLEKASKVSTKQSPFVHSVVLNSILSRSVGMPQRTWDGSNAADKLEKQQWKGDGGPALLHWINPAGKLNVKTTGFSITLLFKFCMTYK